MLADHENMFVTPNQITEQLDVEIQPEIEKSSIILAQSSRCAVTSQSGKFDRK